MKHLTQIEIDQFVANLEHNSSNIIDWQEHINVCDFCSKRIQEALAFNVNLAKFIRIDASPKLKTFIKDIQVEQKETYIAYPIPAMLQIPHKSFVIQLADVGTAVNDIHTKYEYLGSLITKKEDLLIRVIKDKINKNICLYLISDNEKKYQNKSVTLSNSKKKYHSDDHGKVKLGKISLPDIATLTVTVKSK